MANKRPEVDALVHLSQGASLKLSELTNPAVGLLMEFVMGISNATEGQRIRIRRDIETSRADFRMGATREFKAFCEGIKS
jgi:hypothetical protein